jgi:hypothetical protein
MKKQIIFLFTLFLFLSCQEEKKNERPVSKQNTASSYDFNAKSNSMKAKDDFSDLKKKDDESCDTEEEIAEKLAKPKKEAFQLQGGDTGCDVTGSEPSS